MGLWPFGGKKPAVEFADSGFEDLAKMLADCPEDPTPGHDLLDKSRLDFSVESLAAVDEYLDALRPRKPGGEDLMKVVLRCGAYAGEVIRRSSSTARWHWVSYEQAVRLEPKIGGFGRGLGTLAALWNGKTGFCFPLGKVGKFLENGPEDSVKFFARAILLQTGG